MVETHVLNVYSERSRLPAELIGSVLNLSLDAAQNYRHPTPTDPDVVEYVINTYSHEGEVVYDPMCGVGTLAKAALLAGRHGYGSDIVDEYVRLGNEDIQRATGHGDHIRMQSALQLGDAAWLQQIGPVDLCFFSPALMNINRPNYPLNNDQLGNYRAGEQTTWLESVRQIMAGVKTILSGDGYMVVNTRNQQAEEQMLSNVHFIAVRAIENGYKQVDEVIVLFPNEPTRWPEYLLTFQQQ